MPVPGDGLTKRRKIWHGFYNERYYLKM